jgi:lactoylglutathione lyase
LGWYNLIMENAIEWVILLTSDYQKSLNFYRDILGFVIEREVEEDEFAQFKFKNLNFAIYGKKHVEKMLGKEVINNPSSAIYSFPDSIDVDKDYQILKNKGVKFIKEPELQPWGQKTAYFADPDGHIWEIQQWIK